MVFMKYLTIQTLILKLSTFKLKRNAKKRTYEDKILISTSSVSSNDHPLKAVVEKSIKNETSKSLLKEVSLDPLNQMSIDPLSKLVADISFKEKVRFRKITIL